jgi:hypothetical protein
MPPVEETHRERAERIVASTGLAWAARDYVTRYLLHLIAGAVEPSERGKGYTLSSEGASELRAYAHELLAADDERLGTVTRDERHAIDPYARLRDS